LPAQQSTSGGGPPACSTERDDRQQVAGRGDGWRRRLRRPVTLAYLYCWLDWPIWYSPC